MKIFEFRGGEARKRFHESEFLNSFSLQGYACACNRISKQIPASSHLLFVYFPRFLSLVIASYIMHINSSYLWSTDVCFMFWKKNQETLFCFEELPREPEAHQTALVLAQDTDLKHGRLLPLPKQVIALPATKNVTARNWISFRLDSRDVKTQSSALNGRTRLEKC